MLNISKDETKFNDLEEKMWKKKIKGCNRNIKIM